MKKLFDILTVLLLVAAFGILFYTGFIGKGAYNQPLLATGFFSVISIFGTIALLLLGMISALMSRVKRNLVTNSFLAFAIVQSAAVIAMILSMAFIWSGVLSLSNKAVWAVYIISVLVVIVGYVDGTLFSDLITAREAVNGSSDEAEDSDDSISAGSDNDDSDDSDDVSDLFASNEDVSALFADSESAETNND